MEQADAVMMYHAIQISSAVIERFSRCKVIVRCGVGVDNVDSAVARRCGIPVTNVPDYGTNEVADSAIGLLLSHARGIHMLDSPCIEAKARGHFCRPRRSIACKVALWASSASAVSAGPWRCAPRPLACGCCSMTPTWAMATIRRSESSGSRVLAICIDAQAISQMPRGSFLVNTARGGIVDSQAVVAALAEGHLAGAGIDVLAQEPPAEDHPLLIAWRDPHHPAYNRLILNPHSAFYSEEGLLDMRVKGSESCRRALLGQPLRNLVN